MWSWLASNPGHAGDVAVLTSSLNALEDERFDFEAALHLLNRAGFGGTPDDVQKLVRMGLDGAVDHLVDYRAIEHEPVEADDFDHDIMRPLTADERMQLRRARESGNERVVEAYRKARQQAQRADRRQMAGIQQWWMRRMIDTPRPLEEKMTLFWHGHFASSYRGTEDSYHMFLQNQLFRAHALGNFKTADARDHPRPGDAAVPEQQPESSPAAEREPGAGVDGAVHAGRGQRVRGAGHQGGRAGADGMDVC
jgi:hypothetical protein